MKYGVCTGVDRPENVFIAKKAGFDYIECGFSGLARESDEVFEAFAAALRENDIRCEAANGFFPRDYKLIGPDSDPAMLAAYIRKGMERGSKIGLKTVVLGSGRARDIPENTGFAAAFSALADFIGNIAAPIASLYGVEIVIEPLRADESTIIHTVTEGVMLAAASGAENVSGLADLYHMLGANDTNGDILALKGNIKHGHISNPRGTNGFKRIYPADASEFDYRGFVNALREAGCERCSVEANCSDFAADAPKAAAVLKSL